MFFHAIDERDRGSRARAHTLIHWRGFANGVPRPIIPCRLLGHLPVVDGYDSRYVRGGKRWVECGRCHARPEHQGALPVDLPLGSRYRGPWQESRAHAAGHPAGAALPCRLWREVTTDAHVEVLLPRRPKLELAATLRVGTGSSETPLDWHVGILGANLYWSTGDLGCPRWVRRRGIHATSRTIGITAGNGRIRLMPWAPVDTWSSSDPSWWEIVLPVQRWLVGDHDVTWDRQEPALVDVPLPEGVYRATLRAETHVRTGRRWPHRVAETPRFKLVFVGAPPPVPGKGENSWDCGDDATYSLSAPLPDGTGEGVEWHATAIAEAVRSVLRTRLRYAGPSWSPDKGWPSEIERLNPRVPSTA